MIWVTGQNKDVLVEATNFRIYEARHNSSVTYYSIRCDVLDKTYELGGYSTEEKALKVLDKIQRAIISQLCDINRIVFQMPQDDEVEA